MIAILQRRKDQWYAVHVKIPHTNPEDPDYGVVIFRLWIAGEVAEISGDPIWQRSVRAAVGNEQLSVEEHKKLFELKCDFVSRATKGLPKDELVKLGDWAFVSWVFRLLQERTGVGTNLAQDIGEFFRDPDWAGLRNNLDTPHGQAAVGSP